MISYLKKLLKYVHHYLHFVDEMKLVKITLLASGRFEMTNRGSLGPENSQFSLFPLSFSNSNYLYFLGKQQKMK